MRELCRWRLLALAAALGIAAISPRVALGQTGKMSGVVKDASSGQPIEGVQVVVSGTGYGAVTQATGRFFIVSVPPGTYTLVARRIGYQTQEVANVEVRIDVTREVNFSLNSSAGQLAVLRITAPPTPLVEIGTTGSAAAITADVIQALPVTSVAGVLALQQGFLEVPQNTDITSFSDSRRNVLSPIRIRGGRAGETLTLIDGIPINNVVFGGRAFDITTSAVQQIDYQKGGFEPQYGNALSGIINIATREGGTTLAGNVEYQSTGLSGQLGNSADDLRGYDLYRGFLSGPVPGTQNRVRFLVAGQQESGRDAVLQFDNDVYDYDRPPTNIGAPDPLDLIPGWRAFGYDREHDIFGKLTIVPTAAATTKLSLTAINYERQRLPFDFDYLLTGFNPLTASSVNSLRDTLGLAGLAGYGNIVQGSIRAERQLYVAGLEQRFGRSNLKLKFAKFDQNRQTCNFFNGICLGDRFSDINFNGRFVAPGISQGQPVAGTDEFYGGEKVNSTIFRGDVESQVTDHHNVQGGVFYQSHDILFAEWRNLGTNAVFVVPQRYAAKPYDAAAYFQDKIEYDFLTVKLGFRYDYGSAKGSSFTDPLNPLNGTSAREVCNGAAPGIGATTPFTGVDGNGAPLSGFAACNSAVNKTQLTDSAAKIAQKDDFKKADARSAFSPRVGVSFPLSERSSVFFNAGQYSQNPLYNNLYQNTGVGTTAGPAGGNVCKSGQVKPGSAECYPTIFSDAYTPAYIGNTNLLTEGTTSFEVGYAGEIQQRYAVRVTLFSKDETGLTGIKRSRSIQDVGNTYNTALPRYFVVVNQDYSTTRGFEVQFQRRVSNFWGYDINYSFSKSTTNASPPDRQQQSLAEGDSTQLREITSEIDQPQVFNASLLFRIDQETPKFRFAQYLKQTYLTMTARAASGLPYTPTTNFFGFGDQNQGAINSGRGPATFQVDLLMGKDFRLSNTRYGVFARVANVFDRKNCLQVFVTTGRCDAGTIDQRRARNGNAVGDNTASTYFNRPEYYGERRTINTGVRVNF